jgi:hypothetical protein
MSETSFRERLLQSGGLYSLLVRARRVLVSERFTCRFNLWEVNDESSTTN